MTAARGTLAGMGDVDDEGWGLAALGVSGDVEVELLNSHDGGRWWLQLTVGLFRLGVAAEAGVLGRLRGFFAETFRTGVFLDREVEPGVWRTMPEKSCALGMAGDVEVKIHKDGKYDDRYFIVLGVRGGHCSFTPTLAQAVELVAAVGQACDELDG